MMTIRHCEEPTAMRQSSTGLLRGTRNDGAKGEA